MVELPSPCIDLAVREKWLIWRSNLNSHTELNPMRHAGARSLDVKDPGSIFSEPCAILLETSCIRCLIAVVRATQSAVELYKKAVDVQKENARIEPPKMVDPPVPVGTTDLDVVGLGTVRGLIYPNGVRQFCGIPYASLSKRWTYSTLMTSWPDGRHDGTKLGYVLRFSSS